MAAAAQSAIEVRTRDGRTFFADSVETRGDRLVIRPHGLPPVETPVANILCIAQACGAQSAIKSDPKPPAPGKVAIHGSNTLGASFMPLLLRKYGESLPGGAVEVRFGENAEEQSVRMLANGEEHGVVDLAAHGSGTAFSGLLEGKTTIGMSSRSIKPEEAQKLKDKYGVDMLSPDSEHIVALDGLAVIVNRANPARAVAFDFEQLARIFSGEITDWSQVIGGQPAPITVLARDEKSGTYSTFDDMVLKPFKKKLTPSAKRFESSEQLSDAVEADPGAIGFIALPYVRNNHPLSLATGCGLAHAPSRFGVQTEVYPLARRLYLYTLGAPKDPFARALLAYAESPEAQAVVQEAGFIDQSVELEDAQAKAKWLQSVRENRDDRAPRPMVEKLLRQGETIQRASINFRFTHGSATLDNKAIADVSRLAAYLRGPAAGKRWWLVGFADGVGGFRSNLDLAEERADAVADALRRQGVTVSRDNIIAYSWLAPVACNDNDQGRSLNRRVEVWLQ